jgi:hypothetical protein
LCLRLRGGRFGGSSWRNAVLLQLGEAVGQVLQDLAEVLDFGIRPFGTVQSATRNRERDSPEDDSNEPPDEFHKRTMCCGAYPQTKRPAKVAGRAERRGA